MDALTHSLVGIHLARRPTAPGVPPATRLLVGLAASLAPDLDRFLLLPLRAHLLPLGPAGIFHSLPGAALLALALALIARPLASPEGRSALGHLAGIAVGLHLLADLLTHLGLPLFWPFSSTRYGLGWLAAPDFWLWFLLGAPLLRDFLRARRGRRRLSLAPVGSSLIPLIILYAGISAATKVRAIHATALSLSEGIEEIQAYPLGPFPFTWITLARTENQAWYRSHFSFVGGLRPLDRLPSGGADPRMQIALETAEGRAFLARAKAPYLAHATAIDEEGAFEVALGDLRFAEADGDRLPWVLWIRVGPALTAESWRIVSAPLPP